MPCIGGKQPKPVVINGVSYPSHMAARDALGMKSMASLYHVLRADERKAQKYTKKVARFWARAIKTEGCWEWQAERIKNGYGTSQFFYPKGTVAHRVAWELTHGPIPHGMCVCHHCDNPPCINPDHLFLGTHLDNMKDMWAKGRQQDYTKNRANQWTKKRQ